MPVMSCQVNGGPGYKFGESGHCYGYTSGDEESMNRARRKAEAQGAAEHANKSALDRFIDDGDGLIIHAPEQKDALSECVSRKLKILLNEGYERDQALAIAYSMCGEKKKSAAKKAFTEPFPEGEPEVLQGGELVRALQLDIAAEHDAASLYLAHADKVLDPAVKDVLRSVAREELVHIGEFEACIDYLTGGAYSQALGEGVAEVQGEDEQEQLTAGIVTKSVYSQIRKVDDVRHWVTGVVLEPDSVDLQGDVITKEDVRRAMEGYMLKSQAVGRQHEQKANASVVECYLAPMDFRLGDKELVRKDSWVMTVKVHSEALWQDVISGKILGFSIGGKGVRTKED